MTKQAASTFPQHSAAVEAFTKWTKFYTVYDFDQTYDAFTRFRTGEMPMLLQNYAFYNQLSVAAPEIKGLWSFAHVPGSYVTDENGQIKIDGLRIGDYVVSEVSNEANKAYILPPDVTVTVHEGRTVVAKFHNQLKPVTDIPKTGDSTNLTLWAALAGASLLSAGAAAFFIFRKKKEGKHER